MARSGDPLQRPRLHHVIHSSQLGLGRLNKNRSRALFDGWGARMPRGLVSMMRHHKAVMPVQPCAPFGSEFGGLS